MSVYTKLSPSSLMSSTTYIMTQIDPDLRNTKGTSDIVVLVDKAYLRKVPVTENMFQAAGPSLGTCNVCDGTGPPLFRGLQIYIEYIYVYMYCLVNKNVQQ